MTHTVCNSVADDFADKVSGFMETGREQRKIRGIRTDTLEGEKYTCGTILKKYASIT